VKHSYNNDKIIQMNKFIGNLYLFSKLTTTLVLFLIVLLMGYAFVKSYQSQNTNNFKLDEKLLSLIDTIDENQQNLKIIKNKALSTEIALNKFKESLENNQTSNENKNIEILLKENEILKKKLNSLSSELELIKKDSSKVQINNQNDNSFEETVNLIELKFNNGENVTNNIFFLQQINNNQNFESTIEKLIILSEKNFFGLQNLSYNFEDSSQKYLNYKFLKENDNRFIRILSNFVNIQPNSRKEFDNVILKKLFETKQKIKENNITLSLKTIESLPSNDNFFKYWKDQANIYIEFKKNLDKLKFIND